MKLDAVKWCRCRAGPSLMKVHPWIIIAAMSSLPEFLIEEFSRFIDEYICRVCVLIGICFNAMFSMKQILFIHLVVFFFEKCKIKCFVFTCNSLIKRDGSMFQKFFDFSCLPVLITFGVLRLRCRKQWPKLLETVLDIELISQRFARNWKDPIERRARNYGYGCSVPS